MNKKIILFFVIVLLLSVAGFYIYSNFFESGLTSEEKKLLDITSHPLNYDIKTRTSVFDIAGNMAVEAGIVEIKNCTAKPFVLSSSQKQKVTFLNKDKKEIRLSILNQEISISAGSGYEFSIEADEPQLAGYRCADESAGTGGFILIK